MKEPGVGRAEGYELRNPGISKVPFHDLDNLSLRLKKPDPRHIYHCLEDDIGDVSSAEGRLWVSSEDSPTISEILHKCSHATADHPASKAGICHGITCQLTKIGVLGPLTNPIMDLVSMLS